MPKRSVLKKNSSGDKPFLITVFSFLLFGLIIIANATVIHSDSVYNEPYKFVILQTVWILIGLVGFFFFYHFSYKKLDKIAYIFFGISIFTLFVLAVAGIMPCGTGLGFAPCINGANRWLYVNPAPFPPIPFLGLVGFQPAEMAKLALILYLSVQLDKNSKNSNNKEELFWVYLVITGLVSLLVLLQPNMSTAMIIIAIGTLIYFSSGAPIKKLLMLIPVVLGLGVFAIISSPYRRDRLLTLLGGSDSGDLSIGYHIQQVLIALGSGGFWGVGFGQSKQKYQYLPEIASDSIFAIVGEEFGFLGTTLLILAFGYLIFKGFDIAAASKDLLGKMLAVGITSWIGLQFFINIAAMTKIIPLTGVPIPLMSYGGSSMLFSLMGLGILANISKNI